MTAREIFVEACKAGDIARGLGVDLNYYGDPETIVGVEAGAAVIAAALAAKEAECVRLRGVVLWLRLVAECVIAEVVTLDPLDESLTIEDDPMNWHDESVKLTAQFDNSGLPIETPKLRAKLEAALAASEGKR